MREGWRVLRAVMRAVLALPPIVRGAVLSALFLLLWLGVNWAFHTFHKPTEILFPLDRSLNKSPVETWREYESLFREHATAVITPEFLAALAQVEGGGNPVARTYWRWELTLESLGTVSTGVDGGWHVPDHRRDLQMRRPAIASTTTS